MTLRPWAVTGATALCAGTALALVVSTSDPAVARWELFWVFWAALGAFVWALTATLLLWYRISLTRSAWIASAVTIVGIGAIAVRHILG